MAFWPKTTTKTPTMVTSKGLKIVIVDDSAAMRSVLRTIVKENGHDVVAEAADGAAAVAAVARLKPAIVTLDLEMPGIDGFAVLDEITRNHPDTHVVMVSASNDPLSRKRAFDLGAIGFVGKPFNAGQILGTLEQAAQALAFRPAAGGAARRRCVIVDDNRSIRLLLKAILEGAGIAVVGEAGTGTDAAPTVLEHRPDLVCLDIELPGKDGLAVLAELKAAHPALPVIMISSASDRETITRAVGQGASGYILKPFDPEKVMAAVRRVVRA